MNRSKTQSKPKSVATPKKAVVKTTKRKIATKTNRRSKPHSAPTTSKFQSHTTINPSHSTSLSTTISTPQKNQKRQFLNFFFGGSRDQRVVYEPLNSFNPATLRVTLVPVAYRFPSYVLPSIDIVSISSKQLVTPNFSDLCYVIDKTPKMLQLPTISAVTKDSKFVQVFAEATVCVSNGSRFALLGDNYVQVLQSLVETSVASVVSQISEEDVVDKQYETFLVTNIHHDLQRLAADVGVDILKLTVMPSKLDLLNVGAQLTLLKHMNEMLTKLSDDADQSGQNDHSYQQGRENPLLKTAESFQGLATSIGDGNVGQGSELNLQLSQDLTQMGHNLVQMQQEAQNITNLVQDVMKTEAKAQEAIAAAVVEEANGTVDDAKKEAVKKD